MYLFYLKNIADHSAHFEPEEAAHCYQVLRHRPGDQIEFTDGVGNMYTGEITTLSKKSGVVQIIHQKMMPQLPYKLQVAIAPTKNINRLEWFIEKACEIGVDSIQFLECEHSERVRLRMDRLHKIMVAACKQSLKAHFPALGVLEPFETFIQQPRAGSKLIAYCNDTQTEVLAKQGIEQELTILIGPEGDFSNKEIELALQHGYTGLSLGNQRLRTETAGIQACSWVSYHFSS